MEQNFYFTPCGQDCRKCSYYQKDCKGCMVTDGVPFWANSIGMEICPIFDCAVNKKEVEHCGNCVKYPCDTYLNLRDPSISEEEWQKSLSERKANLMMRKNR